MGDLLKRPIKTQLVVRKGGQSLGDLGASTGLKSHSEPETVNSIVIPIRTTLSKMKKFIFYHYTDHLGMIYNA